MAVETLIVRENGKVTKHELQFSSEEEKAECAKFIRDSYLKLLGTMPLDTAIMVAYLSAIKMHQDSSFIWTVKPPNTVHQQKPY